MSIFDVTIDPEWKKVDPDYETAVIPLLDAIAEYKATNWDFLKSYFVDMFTLVSLDNNANRIPDATQFLTILALNFNDLTPGTTTYDSETHKVISSTDGTTDDNTNIPITQPTVLPTYDVKTYGRRDRVIKDLKAKALELQWVSKLESLNMEATENSVFIGIYGNPYTDDTPEINIYKEILISKKYLEMLTWLNSPLLSLIVYPRPEYILDVKEDDM